MRKVENTAGGDTMNVQVSRFGQSTVTVTVPVDATVSEVLDMVGISTNGNEQIFVAGTQADSEDILEANDIVSIVTPKQAGTR